MIYRLPLYLLGLFLSSLLLGQRERIALFPAADVPPPRINFRSNCANATAQAEQNINNVRARLLLGGDMWWDGNDGQYVVPKPAAGEEGVSAIYAAGLWIGGRAPGGELKLAAQQYGRASGRFDYYPGPLNEDGTTEADSCAAWDIIFEVRQEDFSNFWAVLREAEASGASINLEDVPQRLLGWPARGNPHFFTIHGFHLPSSSQGLAEFWDANFDGVYNPLDGDYPLVFSGCSSLVTPDQLFFSIFNDAGNQHNQSYTPGALRMEVQAYSFAFRTTDDLNNTTFQHYKFISRSREDLLDTYFGLWIDPDLGCYTDDFVGVDSSRSLLYVYNEDEIDGTNGADCDQGIPTYGDEVPILGINFLQGPQFEIYDDNGNQIGVDEYKMTSMIATRNDSSLPQHQFSTDGAYNFLQGIWADGRPMERGGDGYNEGTVATRFAFSDPPNDPDGWSMCTAGVSGGNYDYTVVASAGPFRMQPGAVKTLTTSVIWVPDQVYPCPSLERLKQADDLVKNYFYNCFAPLEPYGPDAPSLDIVELDKELVLLLSNSRGSNNYLERYQERSANIPNGVSDSTYRFEGYLIYQLADHTTSLQDRDDPEKVRLIAQMDIANGIRQVFNWEVLEDGSELPAGERVYTASLMVDGSDQGIRHALSIKTDAFGEGEDAPLINHRRYYFVAVAYAYNNFADFDPNDQRQLTQARQYVESRNNIGDRWAETPYYTGIPRPILDIELRAAFGDQPAITRLAGKGNGGFFLEIDSLHQRAIEAAYRSGDDYIGAIAYKAGAGPIGITVVNPIELVDGEYELRFQDANMEDESYEAPVTWTLRCLNNGGTAAIVGERPIEEVNEQIISEYGFFVNIQQLAPPGVAVGTDNGAIGGSLSYTDPEGSQWLSFVPDGFNLNTSNLPIDRGLFNYVNNGIGENFSEDDPRNRLGGMFPGVAPYKLMSWWPRENLPFYLSPVWQNYFNNVPNRQMRLEDLNNVDLVFSSDKSLWSRCPVVETRTADYPLPAAVDIRFASDGEPIMFDTRAAPSVTKEAGPDGLPMIDENIDAALARGMGWFPGYAVDVETGQRLQVFWGENSVYDGREVSAVGRRLQDNGGDMIWNPSSVLLDPLAGIPFVNPLNFPAGGQHYIYITKLPYDEGVFLESRLEDRNASTPSLKGNAVRAITWAIFPLLATDAALLSYADGIIPNEARLALRVVRPYDWAAGEAAYNGYGTYRFSIDGKMPAPLNDRGVALALDQINIVPNPYYAASAYEHFAGNKVVKITNLPARCEVTIFTLDGKFIRRFQRNEMPIPTRPGLDASVRASQILPALEWDLTNASGHYVASGVYLIHVNAYELGERTLKFFGVNHFSGAAGG